MNDRILVVNDDPSIRAILAGLLRKSYTIDTAATGESALELAAREPPAVVLLDIILPGIDGYETCRRLKSSLFDSEVQVIMISASSSQEEQLRAFEAGADAYMVKPVDANVLRSEVQLHSAFVTPSAAWPRSRPRSNPAARNSSNWSRIENGRWALLRTWLFSPSQEWPSRGMRRRANT